MLSEFLPLLKDVVSVAVKTVLGMALLGIALLIVAWKLGGGGLGSLAAIGIVAVTGAVATGFLTLKRSVLTLVIKALSKLRLADRLLAMIFAYDGFVALNLEKLPLGQAEELLKRAIQSVKDKLNFEGGIRGFIVRKANERVLELVERATLSAFRADGANGVDIVKVRKALSDKVDDAFVAQLEGGLTRITAVVVTALVFVSVVASYFCGRLLQ